VKQGGKEAKKQAKIEQALQAEQDHAERLSIRSGIMYLQNALHAIEA